MFCLNGHNLLKVLCEEKVGVGAGGREGSLGSARGLKGWGRRGTGFQGKQGGWRGRGRGRVGLLGWQETEEQRKKGKAGRDVFWLGGGGWGKVDEEGGWVEVIRGLKTL